jgi:hypothetical protein
VSRLLFDGEPITTAGVEHRLRGVERIARTTASQPMMPTLNRLYMVNRPLRDASGSSQNARFGKPYRRSAALYHRPYSYDGSSRSRRP